MHLGPGCNNSLLQQPATAASVPNLHRLGHNEKDAGMPQPIKYRKVERSLHQATRRRGRVSKTRPEHNSETADANVSSWNSHDVIFLKKKPGQTWFSHPVKRYDGSHTFSSCLPHPLHGEVRTPYIKRATPLMKRAHPMPILCRHWLLRTANSNPKKATGQRDPAPTRHSAIPHTSEASTLQEQLTFKLVLIFQSMQLAV